MKNSLSKNENKPLKLNKENFTRDLMKIQIEALSEFELPPVFHQLVIFLIDGSNSMKNESVNGITKAEEIDKSISSIMGRLAESRNASSFDVCFVAFSDDFKDVFGIKSVTKIQQGTSFNPLNYITPKGTEMSEALSYAKECTDKYLEKYKDLNSQVLIIILTDGAIDDYSRSSQIISELKSNDKVTISCQFLEKNIPDDSEWYSWDEVSGKLDYDKTVPVDEVRNRQKRRGEELKLFATSDELFITSVNPELIRKHMIKSISMVSKVL